MNLRSHVLDLKLNVMSSKCVPSMKTLVSSANNIEKSRSEDLEKKHIYNK